MKFRKGETADAVRVRPSQIAGGLDRRSGERSVVLTFSANGEPLPHLCLTLADATVLAVRLAALIEQFAHNPESN